jgi:outer membrane lipoprotein-sorting protein
MTNWLLGLAALALVVVPARAQDADTAEAVVKKGIEAHGGADVLKKLRAGESKMKGDMTVTGMDIEFTGTLVYQLPDKFRMEIDAEVMGLKLAIVQVVNGNQIKSTLNGMATPVEDAERKELQQAAMLQEITQLTPLLEKDRYKIKLEKPTDAANVVLVTAEGLNDTRLHFDKKSGLLVKTERKGLSPGEGEVNEETVMSDFKEVDGMKVATKVVVNHDGKKFMTMTVTDIKLMEKADEKKFAVDD